MYKRVSWAEKFGQFVMRGRLHASAVVLLCVLLPFFAWIGAIVIALVTLRRGALEGFLVLLWGALPYIVLMAMRQWGPVIDGFLLGNLFVFLLAVLLQRFASWKLVLEMSALVGVVIIMIMHLMIPDMRQWWHTEIMQIINQFTQWVPISFNMTRIEKTLQVLTQFATGIQGCIVLITVMSELMLGRIWQSRLYAPELWFREWLSMRLDYFALVVLIICAIAAWFNVIALRDSLPIVMFPFMIAGISLVHGFLTLRHVSRGLIIGFYVLVVLAIGIFPIFLVIFVIAAMLDVLFNFRKKLILQLK